MPPPHTKSLQWALEEHLWQQLLALEEMDTSPDLLQVRTGRTIACLLPYLKRLAEELQELQGSQRCISWYVSELPVVSLLVALLRDIESYLSAVFEWCIELQDLKLCSQLKTLTVRVFNAQQLLPPLSRKCAMASLFVDIRDSQLHAVKHEVDDCATNLRQIMLKNLVSLPEHWNLKDVFDKIRSNDISHLTAYSAKLASLSVFSGADTDHLKGLQNLALRMDALKFSMVLLKQQVSDFRSQCSLLFPKSCVYLQQELQALERKWTMIKDDYKSCKANVLDKNCDSLFWLLINETLEKVHSIKRTGTHWEETPEEMRLDLKLCSAVIHFIHNAFKEGIITRPDLTLKYNEILLPEWDSLNLAMSELPEPELESRPSISEVNTRKGLQSPFEDRRRRLFQTPDFLKCMTLDRIDQVADEETPTTSPQNTPLEESAPTFATPPKKAFGGVVGLGIDLGLECHQFSGIPISAMKKDRIYSLSITQNIPARNILVDLRTCSDTAATLSASQEMFKSRIPKIVTDHHKLQMPKIPQRECVGLKIPVIARAHKFHSSTPLLLNVSKDTSLDTSILYDSLRTPPGFNLSYIRDTSTPRHPARQPVAAASYCLGLMTPENTLDAVVADQYLPGILNWGSRPPLRRQTPSGTTSSVSRSAKKPWK